LVSLENDTLITLKKQTKRSWESPKIEMPYKLRNKKSKKEFKRNEKKDNFDYLLWMSIDLYRNWSYIHGAFFKQCPNFNIIFLETSNGNKGIVFYKGGNIKPRIMKQLYVGEKSP
jgi:hypothetical protein